MKTIDLLELLFRFFTLGMRQHMMVLRTIKDAVVHSWRVPTFWIDHQRGDSCKVLLKGDRNQVHHQPEILTTIIGAFLSSLRSRGL